MLQHLGPTLSTIYSSQTRRQVSCTVTTTRAILRVLAVLRHCGFIYGFYKNQSHTKTCVYLRYISGQPAIDNFKLYSRPGRRFFVSKSNAGIRRKLSPWAIFLYSSPSGINAGYGLLDSRTCKGELLGVIW